MGHETSTPCWWWWRWSNGGDDSDICPSGLMTTSDASSPVVSKILEEQHTKNRNSRRLCLERKREIMVNKPRIVESDDYELSERWELWLDSSATKSGIIVMVRFTCSKRQKGRSNKQPKFFSWPNGLRIRWRTDHLGLFRRKMPRGNCITLRQIATAFVYCTVLYVRLEDSMNLRTADLVSIGFRQGHCLCSLCLPTKQSKAKHQRNAFRSASVPRLGALGILSSPTSLSTT